MEDYRINLNYAKALFLVASDMGQLDAVCSDMRTVSDVCSQNHILGTLFANPVIRESKKVAVLSDLFSERVSKISMLFLTFVVRKRRAVNLKGIANAFVQLYRDENNIVLSTLVTASEVGDDVRQAVCDAVGNHTGKQVELTTKVDPSIMGGFSVTYDNNMYDARISSQIARLRKEFSKNVYESKL